MKKFEYLNIFIESNELKYIITTIIETKVPDKIREIGESLHPRFNKSNYEVHKEQIYQLIENIINAKLEVDKQISIVLTCIKLGDVNTIDINLHVSKKNTRNLSY